ncbi:hypothetical protein NIES2098_00490 [Calothrix sp. NIES-2098]|nr:hypothetical protein NIES2098_00490 [Calothrix sp. NIES-2098]
MYWVDLRIQWKFPYGLQNKYVTPCLRTVADNFPIILLKIKQVL